MESEHPQAAPAVDDVKVRGGCGSGGVCVRASGHFQSNV